MLLVPSSALLRPGGIGLSEWHNCTPTQHTSTQHTQHTTHQHTAHTHTTHQHTAHTHTTHTHTILISTQHTPTPHTHTTHQHTAHTYTILISTHPHHTPTQHISTQHSPTAHPHQHTPTPPTTAAFSVLAFLDFVLALSKSSRWRLADFFSAYRQEGPDKSVRVEGQ